MPRVGKTRRPYKEFCDDIVGWRRDAILREHCEWLTSRDSEEHEKDFSEAPIAKWLAKHTEALATQRAGSSSYYKNTKSFSKGRVGRKG